MKKVYIVPKSKAIILDESEIIAQSVEMMGRAGSNINGGPTAAEVKETKWGEIEW